MRTWRSDQHRQEQVIVSLNVVASKPFRKGALKTFGRGGGYRRDPVGTRCSASVLGLLSRTRSSACLPSDFIIAPGDSDFAETAQEMSHAACDPPRQPPRPAALPPFF